MLKKRELVNSFGMTLVEIMIAVGIIMLVAVPLAMTVYKGVKGAVEFSNANKAIQLAQELMEEIKQEKWDETTPDNGDETTTPSTYPFSLDTPSETAGDKTSWDDIDDYDDFVEHPAKDVNNVLIPGAEKFTRTVDVRYVNIADATSNPPVINLNPVTAAVSTSQYKEITVTVTWEGMSINAKPITISTIISNIKRY